jgi:hypothetical protein
MRTIGWASAASLGLVVVYLALGGASYAPAKVADPCAPREWRDPGGFQAVAEQIVLSALDGAACELGVSREDIVLAFASRESLQQFARAQGVGLDDLGELARSGLMRAIADAEQAGALDPSVADMLRSLARRISVPEVLDLLELFRGTR